MHTPIKENIASSNNKGGSFFSPAVVQPKLTVNEPGDMYEQEADAMADKVMRMTDIQGQPPFFPPAAGKGISRLVQRKCAACEHEEKEVQRKENGQPVSEQVSTSLNSTKSGGQPLQHETRNWMEDRFGTDFSGVKVHTGSQAVQLSRDLNAQAFTHGSDIYFNEGKYNPSSDSGKHLLAHELTHVVQQTGPGPAGTVQRSCGVAAIGPTPPDCTINPRDPLGARFLFNINCDEFAPGQEAALVSFASAISPNEGVDILGVASQEGPADFNMSLSCKRAAAVRSVLIRSGIPASRIGRVEAAGPRGRAGDANMRAGVIDLVSIMSETMAPSPGLITRTTIGVGEDVILTHSSGNINTAWTASAGTLMPPTGAIIMFRAPDTAQTVTITAGGASIRFNVVAPTGVFMERRPGTNIKHLQNLPTCGLVLDVYLQPDNVNFSNVIYRELDVVGVPFPPGGAYSCNPFRNGHCQPAGLGPCRDKIVTQTVVAGKGSKSDRGDCAYSGHCFGAPPFTPGSVFLVIPYEYKVGTGSYHHFSNVLQMHTLLGDANTIVTSKANASDSTTVTAPQSLTPECPLTP